MFAICLSVTLLLSAIPQACAAGALPGRFIAIAYDDSGSMRYLNRQDTQKTYIYANYALQSVAAMMADGDTAKVFRFSDKGQSPVAVTRQKNLLSELKGLSTVKGGGTYAESINQAFLAGAAYLAANPQGQFLFVLITDGGMMFGNNNKFITSSLKVLFAEYLKNSGLAKQADRMSALLVSPGSDDAVSSVSDMAEALKQSRIPTQTFQANVMGRAPAQDNMMIATAGLAKALYGTNVMAISPGKPFTIPYPLESFVVMEQFAQAGESLITGVTASDGSALQRSTLTSARAIDGLQLACTFSSLSSANGVVKPGQYTLQTSGKVKLLAFLKVNLAATVSITNSDGTQVALFKDNRWSASGIRLSPGEALTAKVSLAAPDDTPAKLGPEVKLGFGDATSFTCTEMGQGEFEIRGATTGAGQLSINVADPEYFQIAIPALSVEVQAAPAPTASASPSASPTPTETPQPEDSSPEPLPADTSTVVQPVFDKAGFDIISKNTFAVQYTSSAEYKRATQFTIEGKTAGTIGAEFKEPFPKGLQIRFNGVVFDEEHLAGNVDVKASNALGIWVDSDFAAPGKLALQMLFSSGETLNINVLPQPRPIKVELSSANLGFSVLAGRKSIPSCMFTVLIQEDGKWAEATPASLVINTIQPGGFAIVMDKESQKLSVYPGEPALLTPVGRQTVTLQASSGKPGEQANGEIHVLVQDDWRKWLIVAEALAGAIVILYLVLLASKKRLPRDMAILSSGNSDMAFAVKAELRRNLWRRNFWPFGRETFLFGLLEIYPHPRRRDLVILSGECAQYGLRIDGRPPQYHRASNEAGDYIISANNIIGIHGFGGYRYYRIIPNPSGMINRVER